MTGQSTMPQDVRVMHVLTLVFAGVAMLMALVLLGWWVIRQPLWTIQAIEVRGHIQHQSEVVLRAHLAHRLNGSFLNINLQHISDVVEELPWVRRAVAQRVFPNRIRLVLEEHQGVAWWGEAQSGRIVNSYGEIFEAVADESLSSQWPELSGPDAYSAQVLSVYQSVDPLFKPLNRDIVRFEMDVRGAWRTRLDNGARIELGRGDIGELTQRTQQFTETASGLSARYGQRDIESADLRYPNGYALRLRGVTTLATTPSTSS